MGRRAAVTACARTVSTFLFGFGLGFVIHLLSSLSFTLSTTDSETSDSTQQERGWRLEQEAQHQQLRNGSQLNSAVPEGVRLLCYVLTGPSTHHTAVHVKNTWAQRCDKTVFYSTEKDVGLQTEVLDVPEGYGYLWAKTKGALSHLHHHYPDYHWYLKADDDTYVIVENLRFFLRNLDPGEPIYYGVKFRKHVKQGYMSGGGGYVLSREAVRRFVTEALKLQDQSKCASNTSRGAEDLQLGVCLESVGVAAGDSLDDDGKSRFFSHSPLALFYKLPLVNKLHWYWRYIWHHHGVGPDCCSRHLVSFHDVDPRMMWTLETLLYRLHIHRDLQPPHLNTSTSTPPPPSPSPPPPLASLQKPPPSLRTNGNKSLSLSLSLLICRLLGSLRPSLKGPIVPALKTMYEACHHLFIKVIPLPSHPEPEEVLPDIPLAHLCLKLPTVTLYPFSAFQTINVWLSCQFSLST
ncbi:LOW QUALITY PROTEIN: glycoprotein-N-acetylgalactosamine 3-beta-galactosyltransferase 1-like [Cherax quadricarinatus]|uniref:LOW QUALITY PROTEIN: glycoprotein-N-acetylgalactosamine 3-beta-galactosyltransferase 1-like n=1 Tax=Cherax quadricarinatus TaxID=27406 RepID=UPI00387E88FE